MAAALRRAAKVCRSRSPGLFNRRAAGERIVVRGHGKRVRSMYIDQEYLVVVVPGDLVRLWNADAGSY